jgi:flagellar basal-body rod modification protein FlgD
MSQISAAASINSAVNAGTSLPSRFSEMDSEDFIRIIFTELTNQDPLQPNDTGALLEQLNSIRSIESDLKVTEQLQALVSENKLASAANMLGKFVSGRTETFDDVSGFAVAVRKQGDDVMLEMDDGHVVPLQNVESVIDTSLFGPPVVAEPATEGAAG